MDLSATESTPEAAASLAPNVCIRCKGRKKKCDKTLPNCARCTRLRMLCQYIEDAPAPLPSPPQGSLIQTTAAGSEGRLPFPEFVSASSFIYMPQKSASPTTNPEKKDFAEQVAHQAFDIITRYGSNMKETVDTYFATVHDWFPLLTESAFRSKLLFLQMFPRADMWGLILSIAVITRANSPDALDNMDQLYMTTKGLNAVIQSQGTASLEMVQAMTLIALHEHCQALSGECFLSLGAAARMGYLLGLDKTVTAESPDILTAQKEWQIKRRTWWSIIILERVAKLEAMEVRAPFAIPSPSALYILPSDDRTVGPTIYSMVINLDTAPDLVTSIAQGHQLSFAAGIAQAAHLLGRTIELVNSLRSGSEPDPECSIARLNDMLQTYAMSVLLPGAQTHHCWPYILCLTSLALLNRAEMEYERATGKLTDRETASRATLALQSLWRMIIEGIRGLPESYEFQNHVPAWALCPSYIVAQSCIQEHNNIMNTVNWEQDCQLMRKVFGSFAKRWKLAEKYLTEIDTADRAIYRVPLTTQYNRNN